MKKIGIYDSGSGGLSVLNHLINGGYAGEIYYYADTINNPWGNKSKSELLIILNSIATWFQEMNVNAIYSGCNTTLSLFKEGLSDIFNTHVHTILENTANHYNENEYSVICTENSHQYQLFSTFFPHKKIEEIPCPNLANLIETNQIEKAIHQMCHFIKQTTFQTVILGCTHYPLILNNVQSYFPNKVFIDPASYIPIPKHTKHTHPMIHFKVSGDETKFKNTATKYLNFNQYSINGTLHHSKVKLFHN